MGVKPATVVLREECCDLCHLSLVDIDDVYVERGLCVYVYVCMLCGVCGCVPTCACVCMCACICACPCV